jgi:heterotetrameric sarcosine oxidase gamma subunit
MRADQARRRAVQELSVADSFDGAAGRVIVGSRNDVNPRSLRILSLDPQRDLLVSDELLACSILACGAVESMALAAVLDLSTDDVGVLSMQGAKARDVLSTGCGLDLRGNAFAVGRCARTRFCPRRQWISMVVRTDRRYRLDWFDDAAAEFRNEPL